MWRPRTRVGRWGLTALGGFFVVLGAIGVFVPGLPTTIFLIVACFAFARSCPAMETWLRSRSWTQPFLPYLERVGGLLSRRSPVRHRTTMSDEARGPSAQDRGFRAKLSGLALEGLMVIFAVLVALAVDEWREGRQYRDRAERARNSVMAELRSNQNELHSTRDGLAAARDSLAAALVAIDSGGAPLASLDFSLPEFSSAAWKTAQTIEAATHLELEWLVAAGRAYETQELYEGIFREILRIMGGIGVADDQPALFAELLGQLNIALQIHDGLQDRYTRILAP
jgi:hypothetical protein